ncbi:fatty acid desaturase family protein [Tomitella gaofuii]|uniref:fatty acid desaturase family protein n=1 Tax=Tomitella gaofuii TaxID=2760083 RepID=UPI0015F919A1|nr:acyl-CoA desaturase [Tomitella gaofuii]
MAITDVVEYAHLTDEDVEALGREFDAIRRDVEESRGESDARYIRTTIRAQRALDFAGRLTLALGSDRKAGWLAGTAILGTAKIIENMEIGHNVMHGQWDWMNDPEIHSSTWEWDIVGTSENWKYTHNHIHHKYTNVLGIDDDIGYGLLRVTRDQRWSPFYAGNVAYNAILQLLFEYGVAIQALELGKVAKGRVPKEKFRAQLTPALRKMGKQILKDYVLFPALSGRRWKSTLTANLTANATRNVWTNAVIFCGHFPDGAEKFTKRDVDTETRAEWYLRQMLGSANISGGRAMDFMTGNLSYQIEHHLFPDLPSNRYAEVAVRVRELADKYDLPYTTGPLLVQYGQSWRTIAKLSLPNKYLRDTVDAAPETNSEHRFDGSTTSLIDPATGRRRGLASALKGSRRGIVRRIARGRSRRDHTLAAA